MLNQFLRRPEALLVAAFAGLIVIGTGVLLLPVCHAEQGIGVIDALFTATSAACVTGLITRDTAAAWTPTGQIVILVLIQLGGLGVMTFAALAFQVLRLRATFSTHAAVRDVFLQSDSNISLRTAIRGIFLLTLAFEALGGLALYFSLPTAAPGCSRTFTAVFLSISAFCNAGFSVFSDSLAAVSQSHTTVAVVIVLIVAGGLGYPVWFELIERAARLGRPRSNGPLRISLNTRVVLALSGAFILIGFVSILGCGLTSQERSWGAWAWHGLFQSVTCRTAGFNTVDIGHLPLATLMIMIALMFVGGSPGSCAGGIKTTSLAVWTARILARVRGQEDVVLAGRRIPHDIVRRAVLLISLAAVWNATGILLLAIVESADPTLSLESLVFEQVSAFGTVGLSTGITASLTPVAKLWIIATMFAGRLGALTIAVAVIKPAKRPAYTFPHERLMIG